MAEASQGNAEWRLSDFLDALAAEVDRAQDTLSFKSFSRGMTVGFKGLHLDVAVQVRVDDKGQVFFRSAEPGQASPSMLRLDLQETFQSQVEEVRRPLDDTDLGLPLSSLPDITAPEIATLQALSIFTVDDLRRFCRTPALLSELSRRTGLAEIRLRGWLGLPFLTRIVPAAGAPGQVAVIEGGNLGAQAGDDAVLFQGIAARVLLWETSRITLEVPAGAGSGPVYARIDGARSNVLLWQIEAGLPPPRIQLSSATPASGAAGSSLPVTLVGSGFQAGCTLSFGASIVVGEVSVESAERMTAQVEIDAAAAPGPRDITATSPGGVSSSTLPAGFTVTEAPSGLTVTGIVPDRAQADTTLRVTISGSGFLPGLTVALGIAVKAAVESVTPTRVVAVLTLDRQAAGVRAVRVINPNGQVGVLKAGFQIIAPPT